MGGAYAAEMSAEQGYITARPDLGVQYAKEKGWSADKIAAIEGCETKLRKKFAKNLFVDPAISPMSRLTNAKPRGSKTRDAFRGSGLRAGTPQSNPFSSLRIGRSMHIEIINPNSTAVFTEKLRVAAMGVAARGHGLPPAIQQRGGDGGKPRRRGPCRRRCPQAGGCQPGRRSRHRLLRRYGRSGRARSGKGPVVGMTEAALSPPPCSPRVSPSSPCPPAHARIPSVSCGRRAFIIVVACMRWTSPSVRSRRGGGRMSGDDRGRQARHEG